MFEQNDEEIDKKYQDIQKQWESKRELFEKLKRIRGNFQDIDYYASAA